jgi:hypothetical protein
MCNHWHVLPIGAYLLSILQYNFNKGVGTTGGLYYSDWPGASVAALSVSAMQCTPHSVPKPSADKLGVIRRQSVFVPPRQLNKSHGRLSLYIWYTEAKVCRRKGDQAESDRLLIRGENANSALMTATQVKFPGACKIAKRNPR